MAQEELLDYYKALGPKINENSTIEEIETAYAKKIDEINKRLQPGKKQDFSAVKEKAILDQGIVILRDPTHRSLYDTALAYQEGRTPARQYPDYYQLLNVKPGAEKKVIVESIGKKVLLLFMDTLKTTEGINDPTYLKKVEELAQAGKTIPDYSQMYDRVLAAQKAQAKKAAPTQPQTQPIEPPKAPTLGWHRANKREIGLVFKEEAKVPSTKFEAFLQELKNTGEIKQYQQQGSVYTATLPDKTQIQFDLQSNKITFDNTSEKTFEMVAKLAKASGASAVDLRELHHVDKDTLYRAYQTARKEGLEVQGLKPEIAKKFDEQYLKEFPQPQYGK